VTYKIIISQKASLDYAKVKHHYRSIDRELEQRFKAEVKKILIELEDYPELFQQIENNQRRAIIGSSFPYKLYYEIDSKTRTVRIAGIFHGRKQPEKIKEMLELEQLKHIQDQKRYLERLNDLENIQKRKTLGQDLDRDLGLESLVSD